MGMSKEKKEVTRTLNTSEETINKQDRLIDLAESIARKAHEGQTRWNGEPYIIHLKGMVDKVNNESLVVNTDFIITMWLHDVVEDTDVTLEDLRFKGIPFRCIEAIECLSKKKGENYSDYIDRVCKNHLAVCVKIEDIENNMNDNLKEGSLKDKYRLARKLLLLYKRSVLACEVY